MACSEFYLFADEAKLFATFQMLRVIASCNETETISTIVCMTVSYSTAGVSNTRAACVSNSWTLVLFCQMLLVICKSRHVLVASGAILHYD